MDTELGYKFEIGCLEIGRFFIAQGRMETTAVTISLDVV